MKTLTTLAVGSLMALCAVGCGAPPSSDTELVDAAAADTDAKTDAPGARGLTADQSAVVLKQIDDICGDTWCSGDYNYAFTRFSCRLDLGRCTMSVKVIRPEWNGVPEATFQRYCRLTGITQFEQMVQTAPGGYQSLVDSFYDKVNDCMSRVEASIPGWN
jgi:hypothetical protein